MTDYFSPGDWNIHCADCGRKAKASELVKNWKGLWVHSWHVDVTRHPQDFVRGIPDAQPPAWTQPPPEDTFAATCFPNDQTAVPRRATPGCALPDHFAPGYDLTFPLDD